MKRYVRLQNVIDTRTDKHHSVAIVEEKNARYYVPYVEEEEDETE